MRVFLAGAAGAIGRRLAPLLVAAGHEVTGTTRSPEAARELKAANVQPAIVDVYDAAALARAMTDARAEIVIHQLTDLPRSFDAKEMAAAYSRNARIRIAGTRNLVAAAKAAAARRFIVQSIAFAYAPGREPYGEDDPLNLTDGPRVETVRGAADMERQVLQSGMEGMLRYGLFYGPGTWYDQPGPNLRCTSMPPRKPPCWRSAAARRASTISPTTTESCRSKKPAASSASIRLSGWLFDWPGRHLSTWRHCEERSDEAIQLRASRWIASLRSQ
jgi:nucleoside-diphosphate-sugar epimerase